MLSVKEGDRVRLLAPMTNEPDSIIPFEENMPAGLEGTVSYVSGPVMDEWWQAGVDWDNGRRLGLVKTDSFYVLPAEDQST